VVQYPTEITGLTGTVTGNRICIDLPLNLFGANRPINGSTLFNVTAFSGGRNSVLGDVYAEADSTRSFDLPLGNVSPGPLVSVASRKIHGTAGIFDIILPLTGPRGVECRRPGATGTAGVDYKLIFTFSSPVASCGSANTGSVSSGPNPNQCTVNLTSVPDAQYVTVTLTGVTDTICNTVNASVTMGVLAGDVTGDRVVDSKDQKYINSKSGQKATSANFRADVTVDGLINGNDSSFVGNRMGHKLP